MTNSPPKESPARDANGYRLDFWPYHAENPHIYARFDQIARFLIRKGFERASAYFVFERMRWETAIRAKDLAAYKLNNNFRPDYARLWLERNPDHPDFFELRERSVEAPGRTVEFLLS